VFDVDSVVVVVPVFDVDSVPVVVLDSFVQFCRIQGYTWSGYQNSVMECSLSLYFHILFIFWI